MIAERDRLVTDLAAVIRILDAHDDVLDDFDVAPIREVAHELVPESDELLEENRLLRLGIVGQMKAGKSTLLNLLLFDGGEVLPRAATPMTAALTHIVQSQDVDDHHAEIDVQYYRPEEWEQIRKYAAKYREELAAGGTPGEFLRAFHEHLAMAESLGCGVPDDMDRTAKTITVPIDDLNEHLRSVVGAHGNLTPFVKSVTIRCGSGFPDLDTVDTPGLNDPIVSRDRTTRKLLDKCDAVLLLSYAGSFLDSTDIELFQGSLSDRGVGRCVLIGSKFDRAVIGEAPRHQGNLPRAVEAVEEELKEYAQTAMGRTRGDANHVAIDDGKVLFLSAMCAIHGTKPFAQWTNVERDAFEALREVFPDWIDDQENGSLNDDTKTNLVQWLGREADIRGILSDIRRRKDDILGDSMRKYIPMKRQHVVAKIDVISDDIKRKRMDLGTTNLDDIRRRKEAAKKTMGQIGDHVTKAWNELVVAQASGIRDRRRHCQKEVGDARDHVPEFVRVEKRTRREEKPSDLLSRLWRNFVGEDHVKLIPYEKVVLDRVSVRRAIDDVSSTIRSAIRDELHGLFGPEFVTNAKEKLKSAVAGALDEETEIGWSVGRSIDRAIDKIAARAKADIRKHGSEKIDADVDLSGAVGDVQSRVFTYLNAVGDEVDNRFDGAMSVLEHALESATSEDLLNVATGDLSTYLNDLERDIADRELKLQRYDHAIRELCEHRKQFAHSGP